MTTKMNLIGSAILFGSLAIVAIPTTALAEKCTGTWTGGAMTTIDFRGADKIKYCYISECFDEKFVGDKNSKLQFPVGNRGAYVTLTKRGSNKYKAKYQAGNSRASATYTCG